MGTADRNEKMKRRRQNKISTSALLEQGDRCLRRIFFCLAGIYVPLLLPVLMIGRYDVPSADDFSMGLGTRLAYEATGSVLSVPGKVLSETIRYYRTWIGYFTSCLFTTVSPATFGEKWYALTPAIVLLVLHFSVIVFLYALMEKVLGINRWVRRCMTVLLLFLMIQLMPEGSLRVEAFYWWSGAGNYTLTFAVGLLYLAFLLLAAYADRKRRRTKFLILACMLGFFAGGGNYLSSLSWAIVTVLLGVVLLLVRSGEMGALLWKKEGGPAEAEDLSCAEQWSRHLCFRGDLSLRLFVPMAFFLAGFALSCLAPGNRIRGGEAAGFGAVKSILLSLYYTLSYPLNQWMNWAVLLVLAISAVIFWMGFQTDQDADGVFSRLTFAFPFQTAVLAYGVVSAVVTPALYAQGNMDAGRIQSTFWLHAVLVLMLLEWYLVGGLYRIRQEREEKLCGGKTTDCRREILLIRGFGLFLLVFSLLTVKADPEFYTASAAASELWDGSAAQYGKENEERLLLLRDPEAQEVVLPCYTVHPKLLYFADVSEDPDDWANQKMSEYYGKKSIRGARQ